MKDAVTNALLIPQCKNTKKETAKVAIRESCEKGLTELTYCKIPVMEVALLMLYINSIIYNTHFKNAEATRNTITTITIVTKIPT